jgi:hypothetical protein
MVKKFTKLGNPYNEPPYTQEEEDEIYRRMGGGICRLHSPVRYCEATAPAAIGSIAAGKTAPRSKAAKRPRKPLVAMIVRALVRHNEAGASLAAATSSGAIPKTCSKATRRPFLGI